MLPCDFEFGSESASGSQSLSVSWFESGSAYQIDLQKKTRLQFATASQIAIGYLKHFDLPFETDLGFVSASGSASAFASDWMTLFDLMFPIESESALDYLFESD